MARYSVFGDKEVDNVLQIIGTNNTVTLPRRQKIYDYMVGAGVEAPADASHAHQLLRATADGTSDAVTPIPLDPADAASLFVGADAITVDAAGTLVVMDVGLNRRATYRWVAAPGSEIVVAATDNLGIYGRLSAASTALFHATLMVEEQ